MGSRAERRQRRERAVAAIVATMEETVASLTGIKRRENVEEQYNTWLNGAIVQAGNERHLWREAELEFNKRGGLFRVLESSGWKECE